MANRYRTRLVGSLIVPVALFAALLLITPDTLWRFLGETKLRRDYAKIAVGMALPEVEALMGGPGKALKQEHVK
jgi:hypothetical protein